MRFLSVLFASGVAASLCLSSFGQTMDQGYGSQQTAPTTPPASTPAPAAQSPTQQLKLEDLPRDPHTPTAEEEAAALVARQRAQIQQLAASQANWGPKASSPGITLTMKEISRQKAATGTIITYQLVGTGFPPGVRLVLLRWPLNQNVSPTMGGIVIDASGTAVCGPPAPTLNAESNAPASGSSAGSTPKPGQQGATANPGAITATPCTKTMQANAPVEITTTAAKGEAIRVALIAEDRKNGAATSAVPFPLEGEDRGCKLDIVLGSKDGELVLIKGSGFKADVPFTMGAETFGQKSTLTPKADAQGNFVAAMTPFVPDHDSGDTVVFYQSDACTPTLSFHWGKGTYKVE
jgi:hypothetical protein